MIAMSRVLLPWAVVVHALTLVTLASGQESAAPAKRLETPDELEARARRIHYEALTLDTHKDIRPTLARPPRATDPAQRAEEERRDDPTLWGPNQMDFPKMRAGGLDVAFYVVYVGQGALDADGFENARRIADQKFDAIERMCRRFPGHIELARSPDDVLRIHAQGKLVACIGIENGYAMGEDLGAIAEFHARGARYMSITHNRHSQLGDSNIPAETIHGGLSDLGRAAIEEMNRVGIMVDISHASPTTTLQAIAHSKAPVIASHSSVDAVFDHPRNLSDEELRALAAKGGVAQCVAFASYVKDDGGRRAFIIKTREELGLPAPGGNQPVSDDPAVRALMRELRDRVQEFDAQNARANVAQFVDHIDHAVKVAGLDHVAISSDFDGGGGVDGWNNASETFNVTHELVRRGYTEDEIGKLWSGNTLRVWREVELIAAELQPRRPQASKFDGLEFDRGSRRLRVDSTNGELVDLGASVAVDHSESPRSVVRGELASRIEWNLDEVLVDAASLPGHGEQGAAAGASHQAPGALVMLDEQSGHRHVFADVPGIEYAVTRSDDMGRLAWFADDMDQTWLWTAHSDGSGLKRTALLHRPCARPCFSPDGRFLAYESPQAGDCTIRVIDLWTGENDSVGMGRAPSW